MTPYAVISDVHSNLHALNAVIKDIEDRGIADIYFAGDIVGYGPRPNECIDIIIQRCKILIAGNHDWAVIGYTDTEYFNEIALRAIEWTREQITDKHMEDIRAFKLFKSDPARNAMFVHATPKDPDNWDYLFSLTNAEVNFRSFGQQFCFVGHSHTPVIIENAGMGNMSTIWDKTEIKEANRYIVNAGSVGQPRDGDTRSSYAVVDDSAIEIIRVPYDVEKTQEEMADANLPARLIERLSYGH
ncbi:metallophosphoesterase family protein [Candidatus Magnetominusculus xianensis]|uniref:Phosphodiesterase n=1 Tax=Candidatus Magnetominusculus xianensis TaxID=1748249 RepID=A0ABR5SGX0_9BACT|nr:metallophosphoesterase family protein [Candidatus Magnetominusculus xianensis]KWT90920.1 phosphodiesterase [Candidatus Magnetominusculus xianensis]MBF0403075.1 metallophosphoesterase family protein [Nitrospirota bacterium]